MKECEKILTFSTAREGLLRWMVPAVLCVLASACASTGVQEQSPKTQAAAAQVKTGCTPANPSQAAQQPAGQAAADPKESQPKAESQTQQSQPQQAPQQTCLPKGVIEISETQPVDPEIRDQFQQAVALLKEEKYADAIRLLKAVTGKTSKFTGPYIDLGIAYARTNELDKAEENLKRALELNASHPVAMNELGLVYRKTGRYDEARKLYESLLGMYPDYLPAHKNLGVLCDIYIQDLNCALEQYEEYLKGIPEDEKVKIWVADVKSRIK